MGSVMGQVYANVWKTLQACEGLKVISDGQGFIGLNHKPFENRRAGKGNWCELWALPGGFVHPFTADGATSCQSSLGIRYGLQGHDPAALIETKAAIAASLQALGVNLGTAGVTTWRIIDSTDNTLASYPMTDGVSTVVLLKLVGDWTPGT